MSKNNPVLLEDPVLKALAARHRRTPAQVALRYQLQRGVVVLAKSFSEERMQENFWVRGGAVGSRDLMEAPRFPLLWVTCEAPEAFLGKAPLLADSVHAGAPRCCGGWGGQGIGKELQKVSFGSRARFFSPNATALISSAAARRSEMRCDLGLKGGRIPLLQ